MDIKSLKFDGKVLHIIDQRRLPFDVIDVVCNNEQDIWKAIKTMQIRGAPAIGVAAAFGIYLGIKDFSGNKEEFFKKLKEIKNYLDSARPTAVNLKWATQRVLLSAEKHSGKSLIEIKEGILLEAQKIEKEDIETNLKIGEFGSTLFKDHDTIMTICNSGALATAGYGTAFGVIRRSFEKYNGVKAIALETRPYLQGARLTAFELRQLGIPFHLITDNMAGFIISKGLVSGIVVGADRIATNGDTVNKVGTYTLAVLANYHKIPFYVAAPTSTIDPQIKSGSLIPIEERDPDEVTHCGGKRIAPEGIKVYNFSFDLTPNKLINAIITEKGILKQPYKKTIKEIFSNS
jgi:methylthioribose-1-phosphate isomerase